MIGIASTSWKQRESFRRHGDADRVFPSFAGRYCSLHERRREQ